MAVDLLDICLFSFIGIMKVISEFLQYLNPTTGSLILVVELLFILYCSNCETICNLQGRIQRFSKKGGGVGWALYVDHHGWPIKKVLDFRWSNVRNYKFLEKYFYQYFQIFPIFIDKILSFFPNLLTI